MDEDEDDQRTEQVASVRRLQLAFQLSANANAVFCTTVAHLRRVQLAPTPMMRFPDKASVFFLVMAAAFLIVLLSTCKHSFEPADITR